ncbi:uncharacterized protein Gasu_64850, partial [Galdieria sulphuraria]
NKLENSRFRKQVKRWSAPRQVACILFLPAFFFLNTNLFLLKENVNRKTVELIYWAVKLKLFPKVR